MSDENTVLSLLATFPRDLPCRLTADELAQVAQDLALVIEEIDQEEDDQKETKDAMKERMSSLVARQRRVARTLRRGVVDRTVMVDVMADYETAVAREIQTDTGEVISSRPLTDHERQMPLTPETAAAAEGAMATHSVAPEAEQGAEAAAARG